FRYSSRRERVTGPLAGLAAPRDGPSTRALTTGDAVTGNVLSALDCAAASLASDTINSLKPVEEIFPGSSRPCHDAAGVISISGHLRTIVGKDLDVLHVVLGCG